MSPIDLIIIAVYLIFVFFVATYFSLGQGVEGFLVNKRKTKLALLVFSIVSTNVGAGFFLSVASEAYNTGVSFGISIAIISVVTSLTFVVFCGRVKKIADLGNIHTIPELLTQRYKSSVVGTTAAAITIAGYFFVTALQFVGIGAVGAVISGYNINTIFLIAGIMTVIYTSIGGIRSDLIADTISFIIMTIILLVIIPKILTSNKVDFSSLPTSHMDLLAFGGMSFFLLSFLLALVSAFMFMELWQRVFSAESVNTARKAFLLSAVIQPLFIAAGVILGLTGSIMYSGADKSLVIFKVMVDFLPHGLLGLGLVAILSILMTTVNSLVLVGGSTLFIDIVKPRLKFKNERSELLSLRLLTVGFGTLSLGLAFVFPDIVRLLLMGAFVMMPMVPAIIWSFFEKRPSSGSALASMIVGEIVTFLLIPIMPDTAFGPGFLVSLVILVSSYFLQKRSKEKGGNYAKVYTNDFKSPKTQ